MYSTISGIVIHGDGYGKKLGFPTVNLLTNLTKFPPKGVYAGTAELEGKVYRAGIIIGPSDKIEAHLIGYDGDAYDKEVTLTTEKFLREYKTFYTEKELISQIKKDIEQC
jgi:riboflavin kinase/FMN adenylyltransferase